jgi:sterol desaturase/sphingolipid hydroxylase (fatty acid hydroxylase superfamily)
VDLLDGVQYLFNQASRVFLSLGSGFSLTSLFCALCLAILFVVIKRRQKNRRIRIKTILKALFPKRITSSPSHAADIGYFFLGVFVFGLIFGWAVLSYQVLTNRVIDFLVAAFGARQPTALPEVFSRSAITLALFLAYELGYWIHHYLSHKVPVLWEFHKVHHTASVLTPLTVFRVHPVDTLLLVNILAIATGVANGAVNYAFGATTYQYALTDRNIILVLFIHAYIHLQHTHLWISFRGVLGCIFLSPAHHQVHHSSNPVHFDKNLGSTLAVWDWLFGTLYVPKKEPEKLHFGVDHSDPGIHTLTGGLIGPVGRVISMVSPPPLRRIGAALRSQIAEFCRQLRAGGVRRNGGLF